MLGKGHGGQSRKFRWNGFPEVPGSLGAILKQAGSSRYGKEDPGYLRRCLQMIFSTFFCLKFCKEDPGYLRRFFSNF